MSILCLQCIVLVESFILKWVNVLTFSCLNNNLTNAFCVQMRTALHNNKTYDSVRMVEVGNHHHETKPRHIFFHLPTKIPIPHQVPSSQVFNYHLQKSPLSNYNTAQRYLITRWVAFSCMLCSKPVSLLHGTYKWSQLGLCFISRSSRMEKELEISILPLGHPCLSYLLSPWD